jgi:hypothetical protein
MRTVEELLEQAKHLPPKDRRRLIAELEDSISDHTEAPGEAQPKRSRGLAMFIAMAGTAHSDFTDVSTNKGKHLAEIYAGKR